MKEFQNLAAVKAYSMHWKDMSGKDLESAMFNTCHGDEDKNIPSHLKLIVSGEDTTYSKLWETVEVCHQQSNLLPSYERVLKQIYSPTVGKNRLVSGIQVQTVFIGRRSLHNHEVVTGRTLKDMADRTIKNAKKALGFAKEFLQPVPPYYPSGTGEEHLLKFILDKMHKDLQSNLPRKNYTFPGYMAFVLLGCPMIATTCIKEFTEGELKEPKKGAGRADARKKESKEKARLRTVQSIGPDERGLSFDQVRQIRREKEQEIVLLQDDIQLQRNKYVNDLTILETRSSSLVQQRLQSFDMAKFCKEIKDQEGLEENMADAKSIKTDIKNINEEIKKKSNNTRTTK